MTAPVPLADGTILAADRWRGPGPLVVLLHAGVADRRSWYGTADRLSAVADVIAYDRRGYGDSAASTDHIDVDDLRAVITAAGEGPAWLVGSSTGGRVALDMALLFPDEVAGLVLIAPAVSGAPAAVEADQETERLDGDAAAAVSAGDLDLATRLEAWLWLDGPAGPEGRVAGPARALALDMNAQILRRRLDEDAGRGATCAWPVLEQIDLPVTVAWGDRDVPVLIEASQELARRLPRSRTCVLPATAHLPYLERPELVADLVATAIKG